MGDRPMPGPGCGDGPWAWLEYRPMVRCGNSAYGAMSAPWPIMRCRYHGRHASRPLATAPAFPGDGVIGIRQLHCLCLAGIR